MDCMYVSMCVCIYTPELDADECSVEGARALQLSRCQYSLISGHMRICT